MHGISIWVKAAHIRVHESLYLFEFRKTPAMRRGRKTYQGSHGDGELIEKKDLKGIFPAQMTGFINDAASGQQFASDSKTQK